MMGPLMALAYGGTAGLHGGMDWMLVILPSITPYTFEC
jgi:hypothetical protein